MIVTFFLIIIYCYFIYPCKILELLKRCYISIVRKNIFNIFYCSGFFIR